MTMKKPTVLIVDDDPTSLGALTEYLEESGFEVAVARTGESALRQLAITLPDIILLDVLMPGVDGFETCRRLKQDPHTCDIPVVFMTSLNDSLNRVKGLLAGGVDYITKPVHHEEALVRINAHLKIQTLQQQVQEQETLIAEKNTLIAQQQSLLEEQNEQLNILEASKNKLFAVISEDLQTPVNKLLGFIRLIVENLAEYSQEEIEANMHRMQQVAEDLGALHENLLTWSAMQRGILDYVPEPTDLQELIVYQVLRLTPRAKEKKITLQSSLREPMLVQADYNMISLVMRNLLSNALKFTNVGGKVTVFAGEHEKVVEIAVSDTGVGIEQDLLPHVFQIQNESRADERKTGLGLILCKELVERHGGAIWCESDIAKGTTFKFTLPKALFTRV